MTDQQLSLEIFRTYGASCRRCGSDAIWCVDTEVCTSLRGRVYSCPRCSTCTIFKTPPSPRDADR